MLQSTRTNLWGQLKPKGHKLAGSAPPSPQRTSSIPGPESSGSRMPLGFKDRGGRLQAFARGNSEPVSTTNGNQNTNGTTAVNGTANGNTNGNANGTVPNGVNGTHPQSPEKRPERTERSQQSQIAVPPPLKREMVETAQFPMTKSSGRFAAPALRRENSISHPPHISSPKHSPGSPPRLRARANSDDHHGGLFSGSQLGESFMNSGLTTPQNEPADPMDVAPARTRSPKRTFSPQQSPERNPVLRPARKSNGASFVLRDDGFMTVVTGANSRHNSSHMKDGFQDGPVNGHARGAQYFEDDEFRIMSPAPREAKLPVREVSIRRSYASRAEAQDAKDIPRSSSPTLESAMWEHQRRKDDPRRTTVFHDLDEDLNSRASEDELQMTPKAKKAKQTQLKSIPRQALMESSMPPTNGVTKPSNDKKRRRPATDYDDVALSSMTYTELQKQPFDFDPSTATESNNLQTGADNLEARLDQSRHLPENEQRHFFSTISIDDWEASGEWFVNQFAGFMQSMREARQAKRRMIQEFEWEAATREEAVRLRSEAIDRKLAKMKQDGQRVVEDADI